MTQSLVHTLRYVSAAGDGEAHWIRLEQERTDEAVTVEEAAEFMDSLYGIDSCERGISGDGDAAGEDPEEERFDSAAATLMGDAVCAESEYWTAYVRVYRSHQSPGYVLRSETATVESVEPGIRESVREIIETPGNSHDLEFPFAGDLVLPPGVRGEVRGSTLNLSRPATGPLVVRYTTVYDRVTLHVPVTETAAQDDEGRALRAALDAAGLVAFQGEGARAIAAATALEPPAQDESVSAAELARLCRRSASYQVGGDCWQIVEHYKKCTCSDREAPDSAWTEQVAATCPERVSGGTLVGTTRKFDGYGPCPGEYDAELNSPEYYKRICCHYPPLGKALPSCRITYETYRGGAPIEGGADHWREMYGPDVRLVAVTPPDGICGTLIHEWQVTRQNCCDDITPLEPDPDNPRTISPGGQYRIEVHFGRPGDLTWTLSGGLRFLDGTTRLVTPSRDLTVRADENICPQPRVEVDDGCEPLTMTFDGGPATPPRLSEHDLPMSSYTTFSLTATGGVPPYMWMASGTLRIVSWSPDGATVIISTAAGPTEWCVETVTVIDQCGQQDVCTIRNVEVGRWRQLSAGEYERCAVPGGGDQAVNPQFVNGYSLTVPVGGYYAQIRRVPMRQPGVCGAGVRLVTNTEAALAANCASAGPAYESHYEDGVCVTRHKSSGVTSTTYYNDDVDRAWQWICGS